MTLIHIWASPGPDDAGPYLGITGTWIHSYIPGPHLDLVTVVPPGPHLDDLTGSQEGPHLDLLTQVLIWASWALISVPHRGLTWS